MHERINLNSETFIFSQNFLSIFIRVEGVHQDKRHITVILFVEVLDLRDLAAALWLAEEVLRRPPAAQDLAFLAPSSSTSLFQPDVS